MGKQLAAMRVRFAEEEQATGDSGRWSGVGGQASERAEGCRMCRGTGVRREQRVPDQAIAEIGTFCRCEAGRERWGKCVETLER